MTARGGVRGCVAGVWRKAGDADADAAGLEAFYTSQIN
jgi:hypothetical protein